MPTLASKFEKEAKKGLVVIGVTDEDEATVDAWFERVRPTYPIAILKTDELEQAFGVRGFPTSGVIAPDGNLVYAGSAYSVESALGDALKEARKSALFPKKLDKVRQSLTDGELGSAYDDVLAQVAKAGKDEDLLAWGQKFQAAIEEQAVAAVERAKAQAEAGLVFRAVSTIEAVTSAKTDFPVSEEARTWLAELKATDGYDDEIKGGPIYEKARDAEKERDYLEAVKQYKAAIKKFPESRLAEASRERAQEIIDAGLPGYDPNCGDCKDAKAACKKHAKDVEL
ncbi:MAG: redoxin domain-containing protein [Planctomycetes bacterium]|nr:redoxin domain-containing protein [Planctomycetota bacterium]